jgi:predicted AAA+ superfamily ATPase
VRPLMVLRALERRPTWPALASLDDALRGDAGDAVDAAYVGVVRALLREQRADLVSAVAAALLEGPTVLGSVEDLPRGVRSAVHGDLITIAAAVRRDWQEEAAARTATDLPPLCELAHPPVPDPWEGAVAELAAALLGASDEELVEHFLLRVRTHGTGAAARFPALRWQEGELRGIAHPAVADAAELVGVDEQLERLFTNTEALLNGAPAHNVLLYGPRGSGKSTAVRSLLPRYAGRGLRLVELAGDDLQRLPEVVEQVRALPQRFVLYVDDLSFEQDDRRYHPLKTLLEGSLTARPVNVVLYATSNRRHLLRERLSERPGPGEDDDVHAWDTHNERLALADRFGLTLTFPSATQRRYLEIVSALAEREGIVASDLRDRAVRFADWGNGYSGRTARQFIDAIVQERVSGRA